MATDALLQKYETEEIVERLPSLWTGEYLLRVKEIKRFTSKNPKSPGQPLFLATFDVVESKGENATSPGMQAKWMKNEAKPQDTKAILKFCQALIGEKVPADQLKELWESNTGAGALIRAIGVRKNAATPTKAADGKYTDFTFFHVAAD